jgi:Zn-dependent oligopeptidase
MFSRFAADGVTNADVGRAYRTAILERGGSRPATEMLEDFLGRPPNNEAFLAELGIS